MIIRIGKEVPTRNTSGSSHNLFLLIPVLYIVGVCPNRNKLPLRDVGRGTAGYQILYGSLYNSGNGDHYSTDNVLDSQATEAWRFTIAYSRFALCISMIDVP